ncbi:MAG: hypothetical protein Q8P59_03935 [Dehalococcoidia bacterium]|nr:hypothetical protein [Dehalococcoidia bacterium]
MSAIKGLERKVDMAEAPGHDKQPSKALLAARVVAWFWFPGTYQSDWPSSSLVNEAGDARTTLGNRYKELAGA